MSKEIKLGLATAAILFIWLFGGYYLAGSIFGGRLSNLRAITGLVGLVFLFAGIFLGIRRARQENQTLTYWHALRTGIIISITVAVVISVAGGLHFFLNPYYANDMISEAEQSLRQSNLSPSELNEKLDSVKLQYSFPMQIIQPLIAQSVAGIFFSAILSFFFRTKK